MMITLYTVFVIIMVILLIKFTITSIDIIDEAYLPVTIGIFSIIMAYINIVISVYYNLDKPLFVILYMDMILMTVIRKTQLLIKDNDDSNLYRICTHMILLNMIYASIIHFSNDLMSIKYFMVMYVLTYTCIKISYVKNMYKYDKKNLTFYLN